ncbi:riboflavin kinase-domain-containing protein [Lipomyces oligophaga]|uniref:riboflavin kinase-domain-containing protein n=1 Tax=Lipomyces oligophaga TaxID=45792 RepID=UPI0034CF3F81
MPIAETPEEPYPVFIDSHVISGFGRGSSELGIPTANIPPSDLLASKIPHGQTGIYFGFAKVSGNYGTLKRIQAETSNGDADPDATTTPPKSVIIPSNTPLSAPDAVVLPMVMSLGWNPFYGNSEPSAEVHIVHKFGAQFYGANIKIAVLGYIRPESDFVSVDALVEEIMNDIRLAKDALLTGPYAAVAESAFFI